ncbi:MAG: recombination directionality factor [Anaerolineae bacterium]
MPIKRLQNANRPALRILGKLRKGGPKGSSGSEKARGGFGRDLTYFRFVSPDPEVQKAFIDIYGENPSMLRVYLPYDTPERNFDSWREEWGGARLKHRCDGEFCVKWLTPEGSYRVDPTMQEKRPCPGGCKEVGRLVVILPELWHAGFVGLVTLETHSINDIIHINQVLDDTMSRSASGLRGIAFALRRVPEVISTPNGSGGRRQVEKWLVRIEPASEWLLAQLEHAKHEALSTAPPAAAQRPYDRPDDEGDPTVLDESLDEESEEITEVTQAGAPPTLADAPMEEGVGDVSDAQETESALAEAPRRAQRYTTRKQEPAPRAASSLRWQDDPARVQEFKARCEQLGLKSSQVLQRLGDVRRVSEVPFSFEDTLAVVEGTLPLAEARERAQDRIIEELPF